MIRLIRDLEKPNYKRFPYYVRCCKRCGDYYKSESKISTICLKCNRNANGTNPRNKKVI